MVEIFWITDKDYYAPLRNLLEKGSRESIKVLSLEKLINYKEELPPYSVLCFEVDDKFHKFIKKHELSFDDQIIVPICLNAQIEKLIQTAKELKNANRFHLTMNPNTSDFVNAQNFRTIVKLSTLSRGALEFSQVGKNMNRLVTSTLDEVERLRKLHERLVGLRSESIKGVKVTSKFTSGEAPGGEFFDMIVGDGQMLILLSSTSSYVTTSVLLAHIELLRSLKVFTESDLKSYIQSVVSDLSEGTSLDLMFMIIDNKNLNVKIYNFGQTNILGEEQSYSVGNELDVTHMKLKDSLLEYKLGRNSRIFILSPGIMKMTAGIINNINVMEFFKVQSTKSGSEILNELFFYLKKNREGMFLKRDASALVIEVGQNVIVEI